MFGKFFASTFTGSMLGAGPDVFAVWGYVIANTIDSYVELNTRFLAVVLGCPEDRVMAAIAALCAADPESRNPDYEGRRLIHEGGIQYRVTSHERYRMMRNEDDRRAYNREAKARSRARHRIARDTLSNDRSRGQTAGQHPSKSPPPTLTHGVSGFTRASTRNSLQSNGSNGLSNMSAQSEAEAEEDLIPPNPPSDEGGNDSVKPPTRPERKWAEDLLNRQRYREGFGKCPHETPCGDDYTCIGRLVGERRLAEADGLLSVRTR